MTIVKAGYQRRRKQIGKKPDVVTSGEGELWPEVRVGWSWGLVELLGPIEPYYSCSWFDACGSIRMGTASRPQSGEPNDKIKVTGEAVVS
jgi:hypothetical protein